MAPLIYYYGLSLVFTGGSLYLLANLLSIKFFGRMPFGQLFKKGTPEYKKMLTAANVKSLTITSLITSALIANVIVSISVVMSSDWSGRDGLLIVMPIVVVIMYVIIAIVQSYQYRLNDDKKR